MRTNRKELNSKNDRLDKRLNTTSVRKVNSHFEHLENPSRGLDITRQPVRGDLTEHP
jgi:hypothetical protein